MGLLVVQFISGRTHLFRISVFGSFLFLGKVGFPPFVVLVGYCVPGPFYVTYIPRRSDHVVF